MKTISLLQLRKTLGETVDELRFTREEVVVLKNNKPVARLVPYEEEPVESEEERIERVKEELRAYMPNLPKDYQYDVDTLDPNLLALVGSTKSSDMRPYKERITEYLEEKYGH